MTKEQKIALLADSIKSLQASSKNVKCPGVLRKRKRQLRNLQA